MKGGEGEGEGKRLWTITEGTKPAMGMVLVQIVFAGVNVLCKLAIDDGMDLRILVAYRYLLASLFLAPFAFFLERNIRPTLTWKILMQAFFSGLFGGSLSQNLYLSSMKLTSATFTSAMTNLIPAITFIMAVIFRLENIGIRKRSGQTKILGTLIGVSGAMILTFLKGKEINFSTSVNLLKAHRNVGQPQESSNHIMGAVLSVASCFSYSIWLIIQTKMIKAYPCHYSSTALMSLMGSVQSIIFALCFGGNWDKWHIGFGIRLYVTAFSGIVASGLIVSLLAWCIRKKGPLYASVFNPLMLVIVAIFGSLLLNEKLHIGSFIGTVLIVSGLYLVLWGKRKEMEASAALGGKLEKSPAERETIDVAVESFRSALQSNGRDVAAEPKQRELLG